MTGNPEPSLRILLVEDHETVRQALKLLIDREPDMHVVGEASDGAQAIEHTSLEQLDVVVMDLSMPGMNGVMATRTLKERHPALPVVALTRHTDQTFLDEFLRAGASAYVLKQSPSAELLRAIRAAADGGKYIDPALNHLLSAPSPAQERKRSGRAVITLSDREQDVLRLVAQSHSNRQIAANLNLSNTTVELHRTTAMRKLAIRGRIELLQYALHVGWLPNV
jgi:DNA-binding NarL/FixJ family response regulator